MARHVEKFTPETLENFKALCGQRIVEFLDTRDYPLDVEATQHCYPAPTPLADVRVIPNPMPPMPATLCHDLDISPAYSPFLGAFHDILVMQCALPSAVWFPKA